MNMHVFPDSDLDLSGVPSDLMRLIKAQARKSNVNRVAIVGGVVRDALLHQIHQTPLQKPQDLDLVVEGSAYSLAKVIKKVLGKERLSAFRVHKDYDTVEMVLENLSVDLATSRVEVYKSPGQNPEITPSGLVEDLARRDFTVNAIAIDLFTQNILDPFNGKSAIKNRQLEFLHSRSVADDPTRIVRGARYAARLNFDLSSQAKKQVQSTLNQWPWDWAKGDPPKQAPPALATRLRQELELMLDQEAWQSALENLQKWGGLLLLDNGLQVDICWKRRIRRAKRLGISPLTALIAGANEPRELASRLQLPMHQQRALAENLEIQKFVNQVNLSKEYLQWPKSQWCRAIENNNWHPDSIAISICLGVPNWHLLLQWWGRWRLMISPISPKTLIEQGWKPGPELGKELENLRYKAIDSLSNNANPSTL